MDSFIVSKKRKLKQSPDDSESANNSKKSKNDVKSTEPETEKAILWKEIRSENLCCDYIILFSKQEADELLSECEETITYNDENLSRIRVYGKWTNIPRKQVAFGDDGLSYKFSGHTVAARPWTPLVSRLRQKVTDITGYFFNFVLVNRYKDGNDHIGEHKDDERDLKSGHPIASLSLGQPRDFIFRHQDARAKKAVRHIEPVKLVLDHGGLLVMKHPTNKFWYHSLPPRKKLTNVRVNFTFRQMVTASK